MLVPIKYENNKLIFLDQTLLPGEESYLEIRTKEDLWMAINKLKVRGAPAIGIAAAYGIYISVTDIKDKNIESFCQKFREIKQYIGTSRPTAVNLFWALDRMENKLINTCDYICENNTGENSLEYIKKELLEEAHKIRREDEEACLAMGEHGLELLEPSMGILTHCNAGTLATAKYGTCLAPIYLGQERGYNFKVFADETRPLLQGARLTAFELSKEGVDITLICDNMAATVMKKGLIDAVVVGCDRMAANGDGANKIGTSGLAILAKKYNIPFYMYVPTSTIDLDTKNGDEIEIEMRSGEEIYKMWYEKPMAPEGVKTFNPSFDVTDNENITAIITEKGIIRPPFREGLYNIVNKA